MLFWAEVVCGPVGPALMILGHTVRFSLRDHFCNHTHIDWFAYKSPKNTQNMTTRKLKSRFSR